MHQLVGLKVNLKRVDSEYKGKIYTYYKIDDPEFKTRIVMTHYGAIRYWTPGMVGTMDFHTGRLNICIEEDGTISKVYYG